MLGTVTAADSYGFVSQAIGRIKIGGVSYTATAAGTDLHTLFDDVVARTVA